MTAWRAVLLRHGQTDYNTACRMQGSIDIPLNETGCRQAAEAAVELAKLGITRVISSDMSRCVQTAAPIAKLLGLECFVDARLRERDFAAWEGLSTEEVAQRWPEAYRRWEKGLEPNMGVETRFDLGQRVAKAVAEYVNQAERGETLLFTTHGGAIAAGIATLLGLNPSERNKLLNMDNCHWAILHAGGKKSFWELESYNLGLATEKNPWKVNM